MQTTWQERYKHQFYVSKAGWLDGTEEFHQLCRAKIRPGSVILELGAGPTNPTSSFLATLGEVHGADPDPDVAKNEALASAKVIENDRLPFADGSFDACVSNYVLEHVADPTAHFAEAARVLRPGGVYLFRAPNRYHYVSLVSRLTSHWFHVLVANRLRNLGPGAHDPYPTVYACNTERAVRHYAAESGFDVEELRMIEKEPSYGMSSRVLFVAFMAYERFVNSSDAVSGLRANILAALRKR